MPGEVGNAVIAGHRDTHFRFLENLAAGELLNVESNRGVRHLYQVVATEVVDSRKGSLLLDTESAVLSLVTCYPFNATQGGGPLRYVVTARMLY
jgi:sortase A